LSSFGAAGTSRRCASSRSGRPSAHTSLAYVLMLMREWRGAEVDFKRAIELNPNYPTAHHWYSRWLLSVGRLDEALAEIKRAQELDPTSLIINVALGGTTTPTACMTRQSTNSARRWRWIPISRTPTGSSPRPTSKRDDRRSNCRMSEGSRALRREALQEFARLYLCNFRPENRGARNPQGITPAIKAGLYLGG
jgi:tetratricopeptide (TPR) repeat protein